MYDIRKFAALTPEAPLALALYWPLGAAPGTLGLKVYRLGAPMVLSDSLPMLEHMGVRVLGEANYRIDTGDAAIYLHDFELQAPQAAEVEPEKLSRLFEDAFARVFRGEVENDGFNRLVLLAGLSAEEIVVLRAYAKYLKQIGFAQSQATITNTLANHPRIARMLVTLFRLRFDPVNRDEAGATAQVTPAFAQEKKGILVSTARKTQAARHCRCSKDGRCHARNRGETNQPLFTRCSTRSGLSCVAAPRARSG